MHFILPLLTTLYMSSVNISWAQVPVCMDSGDYWVVQNSPKEFELVVCNDKGKDHFRFLSGSEVKSLIKQTASQPQARLAWKTFLRIKKQKLSERELLSTLKSLKEQSTYRMIAKDSASVKWLGGQYSKFKTGSVNRPSKRFLSKAENSPLEASMMKSHMLSCIEAGGNLMVSEEGTACACGHSEFSNFQDFSCIGRKVVKYERKKREPSSISEAPVTAKSKVVAKAKKSKKKKTR